MYALCLDIGTSSLKGAIISSDGKLISEGRIWYKESAVWSQALSELAGKLDRTFSVSAVAVSGNGPSFIPLYKEGTFGTPLLWFEKTDGFPIPGLSLYLPKALWLKEHRSREYEKAVQLLTADGFFNYLLTGISATAVYDDRFIPFFWTQETAEEHGIAYDKLPPLVHTGDKIGTVTEKAESQFGIKAGIPVFAGGSDFLMAILGTATLRPGQVCDRAGTSEGINYCSSGEKKTKNNAIRIMPHIVPEYTNISVRLPDSGKLFMQDKEQYGLRLCRLLQTLEQEGCPVEALRLTGGQARNPAWNQLRANLTGRRVLVPEIEDGELAGCASAAFAGLGIYDTPVRAAEAIVRIKQEYNPE